MAIRYIPINRNEIQLFRRNKAIKERNRKEITDNTLIALRRVNLLQQKKVHSFPKTATVFTDFVRQQKHKQIINVINYYLTDIS